MRSLFGLIAHATHRFVFVIPECLNAMSSFPVFWSYVQWRYEVSCGRSRHDVKTSLFVKLCDLHVCVCVVVCAKVVVTKRDVVMIEMRNMNLKFSTMLMFLMELMMIMLCYFVFVLGFFDEEIESEEVVRLEREEEGVIIES